MNTENINPHTHDNMRIIQLLAYITEYSGGTIEKMKLFYLMFLSDFFSLVVFARFMSKDYYYFDITYEDDENSVFDIYMYRGNQILEGGVVNGYIFEDEGGVVHLIKSHDSEFINEEETQYIHPIMEHFGNMTTDQLADICAGFNVFQPGEFLTQESILWNENYHELLIPFLYNIKNARETYPYTRDYQ